MSKMRKEYDPNKVKQRKRKPIVYIICEGKARKGFDFSSRLLPRRRITGTPARSYSVRKRTSGEINQRSG